MQEDIEIFNSKIFNENDIEMHFIDIEEYLPEFMAYLEEHFVSICEGDSGNDINVVKKRAVEFFENKNNSTKMGGVAEFIVHLYLKSLGYKQECTYFNLEEKSIKKGFDGYYSKNDLEWIMESKSGSIMTANISHNKKIKEAYEDLRNKVSGKSTNNPWKNAYNHASNIDVNTNKNIRKNIQLLSNQFTNKVYYTTKKFNIIPASTIFLDNNWRITDYNLVRNEIKKIVSGFEYNNLITVSVTKKSIELFLEYIKDKN